MGSQASRAAQEVAKEQLDRAKNFVKTFVPGDDASKLKITTGNRVQPMGFRASYLLSFIEENGGPDAFNNLTTSEVCTRFVLPFTAEKKLSLVETLKEKGRIDVLGVEENSTDLKPVCPHLHICHAWSYNFLYTVDALVHYCESRGLNIDNTILWFDLFCVQHHNRLAAQVNQMEWLAHYRFHINRIRHTVLVVDEWADLSDAKPLKILSRAWCVFEIFVARTTFSRIEVAMNATQEEKFVNMLRDTPENAYKSFSSTNTKNNMCSSSVVDLIAIAGVFEANVGFRRLDSLLIGTFSNLVENDIERRVTAALDRGDDHVLEAADWKLTMGRLKMYLQKHGKGDGIKDISSALEIRTAKFGADDERSIHAMLMLALYYRQINLNQKVLDYLIMAYESRGRLLGEDHPLTLSILNNVATAKIVAREFSFGENALKKCLSARRRILGDLHTDTIATINNLSALYVQQKMWTQAVGLLDELQQSRKMVLGDKHPDHLNALNNYAVCLDMLKRCAEAAPKFEYVLECQLELANNDPPYDEDALQTMFNLGACYERLHRLEDAAVKYEKCMSNRKILMGNENPDTLLVMSQYASVLFRLNDHKGALRIYEEVVPLQKKVLGKDHPDTLITLNNLGLLYSTIHLYHRALPICQDVYLSQARVLGLHHRDTLGAMANLGTALYKVGDYKTSCPVVEQCLTMRAKYLGRDHPDTCSSFNNLAYLYLSMGDDESAYDLFEKALAGRRKVLGDDHPQTQASVEHLIEMYRKMGAYDKIVALTEEMISSSGSDVVGGGVGGNAARRASAGVEETKSPDNSNLVTVEDDHIPPNSDFGGAVSEKPLFYSSGKASAPTALKGRTLYSSAKDKQG